MIKIWELLSEGYTCGQINKKRLLHIQSIADCKINVRNIGDLSLSSSTFLDRRGWGL